MIASSSRERAQRLRFSQAWKPDLDTPSASQSHLERDLDWSIPINDSAPENLILQHAFAASPVSWRGATFGSTFLTEQRDWMVAQFLSGEATCRREWPLSSTFRRTIVH
jgi:hypothetical protein